ncbi:hypothetical protein [Paraconexibacter algicola]|uniref:hypothetical protein n=1 Tax=Paraconexibacter algicola TaxID=2133960 RepID=UPI001304D382|nr:hypothetical protein [Paraconexibacter algicola]
MHRSDVVTPPAPRPAVADAAPPRSTPGPWARKYVAPPPDIAMTITPAGARARAAQQVGAHIATELERGRSLYCVVHDPEILARLGGFDGRALATPGAEGIAP